MSAVGCGPELDTRQHVVTVCSRLLIAETVDPIPVAHSLAAARTDSSWRSAASCRSCAPISPTCCSRAAERSRLRSLHSDLGVQGSH